VTAHNLAAFAAVRGRPGFPTRPRRPIRGRPRTATRQSVFQIQTPICRARVGRGTVRSCVNDGLHLVEAAISRGQIDAGTAP
jgi:hypothetical protein